MAQASGTRTEPKDAPAPRRRRRGLEVGGLVVGIVAGVAIALGWMISTRGQPPRPVVYSTHPPVLVPGAAGAVGGTGPRRAGRRVGRLLESFELRRLGRRRRGLRHPAELLAARLVLLRHLSRPGQSGHRFLAPVRVPAQLGGRPDQHRAGQHVRHPDRRRRLHRPERPGLPGDAAPVVGAPPTGNPACRPTGTGKRTASRPAARSSSSTTITWAAPSRTCRTER